VLEARSVLILDPDDDRQLRIRVALVDLDVAGVDVREVGVEVAGLRIGVCPRIVRHERPIVRRRRPHRCPDAAGAARPAFAADVVPGDEPGPAKAMERA
jgi:hypothetical protein